MENHANSLKNDIFSFHSLNSKEQSVEEGEKRIEESHEKF
jgi:hypothetical protein